MPSTSALAALGSWKQAIRAAAVTSVRAVRSFSASPVSGFTLTAPVTAALLSKYTRPALSFSVTAVTAASESGVSAVS